MNYILFDLEWNSTKDQKNGKYVNEIIEIGACMLNSKFEEISYFSEVVNPVLGDKLNQYVKNLTHITQAELDAARDFKSVIHDFKKWCKKFGKDTVFITWSNTDLHVIVDNYNTFLHKKSVDFINKYCDLQKYSNRFIQTENKNQISLSVAAESLGVDTSEYALHRALDDSRICAEILKILYDEKIFPAYVSNVSSGDFYKRLTFKPYYISMLSSPLVDKSHFKLNCPACKKPAKRLSSIRYRYKAFNCTYICPSCKQKYQMSVKFKKTFDDVIVSRAIRNVKTSETR